MEISGTSALTIFLFVVPLLILVSSLRANSNYSSKKRRPPGPWAFPLVGSIHHMLTSQPQAALRDLAAKHGPVMLLRLGQVDTVVVCSPAAAQEVRQGNDLRFASRSSLAPSEIICYGNLDLAFAPYGDYWRALRKLCVMELLSARKVRHFAPIRDRETMSLVTQIRAAAAAGGHQQEAAVNLGRLLVSCTNSITGLATFGDGYSGERKEQFLSAIDVALRHSSCFCVSDLFPSLWFVDVLTGMRRRVWRAHRQLDKLFDKIIEECEARWKDESAAAGDNLLSIMLRVRDNQEFAFPFGNTNIKAVIVVSPVLFLCTYMSASSSPDADLNREGRKDRLACLGG
jgi:cytochrome P450